MLFEIRLVKHCMHESCCIGDSGSICCRIRSVECKMELEVRELFFEFVVVLQTFLS